MGSASPGEGPASVQVSRRTSITRQSDPPTPANALSRRACGRPFSSNLRPMSRIGKRRTIHDLPPKDTNRSAGRHHAWDSNRRARGAVLAGLSVGIQESPWTLQIGRSARRTRSSSSHIECPRSTAIERPPAAPRTAGAGCPRRWPARCRGPRSGVASRRDRREPADEEVVDLMAAKDLDDLVGVERGTLHVLTLSGL
jgi:hypothetical protein